MVELYESISASFLVINGICWIQTALINCFLYSNAKPQTRFFSTFCSGGLSLAVEGPSKAEITCKDNKDGTCTVSYLPTAPGDYNIIVKFDNKHISGSPFTAKITGELMTRGCTVHLYVCE